MVEVILEVFLANRNEYPFRLFVFLHLGVSLGADDKYFLDVRFGLVTDF